MVMKNWVLLTGSFLLVLLGSVAGQLCAQGHGAMLRLVASAPGYAEDTEVHLFSASDPAYRGPDVKIKNGSAIIETQLPQPDLYVIMVGNMAEVANARQYQLFLDNELVEVTLVKNSNEVQIATGTTPIAFAGLMNTFAPMFDQLSKVNGLKQQAGQNGYFSDSLDKAWDKHIKQIADNIPGFLQQHGNTAIAAFLLSTVWPLYNDVAQMDAWLALTGDKAKNSVYGQSLESQMAAERLFGYGQVAPDFTQNDPDGKPVSLKDFRGKYVLVDFWASWCGPCRMENPNVVRAFERFKSKNFTVLGVSLDRDKPKWVKAIADDNLKWPHVSDLKFWQNEVAQLYKVSSIPQNYLLDPEGRIIGKNLRGEALDDFLQKTLGTN